LFGLAGLDAAYYWTLGATVLLVVGLDSTDAKLKTA